MDEKTLIMIFRLLLLSLPFIIISPVICQTEIPIHSDAALILPKNSGGLDVAIMNYSELNKVEQLKRFEIGMQFPDSILKRINDFLIHNRTLNDGGLNPFLEWSVDLQATFIHEKSGTIETIDGFYYRNFQRNSETKDWDNVPTNYPMRIRFAPKLTGEWNCFLTLKINEKDITKSLLFDFNVIHSDCKGYVLVHPNKKNLERNGQMIYPVGQNFPAPEDGVMKYHDQSEPQLPADKTHKAANVENWSDYLKMVESYFTQGGKYIRTIQTPWSSLLEFEKKGNYYDRLHYAWEQDNLIETCEKHDALILFNLLAQEPFMKFGDYYFYDWDWDKYNYYGDLHTNNPYPAYCYNDNFGIKQAHEMFLLEEDLKFHEQRTRYYIARYGYSTSIYAFELLSEPYHLDQFWQETTSVEPYLDVDHPDHSIVLDALNNYQNRMSDYIKNTLNTNQLIGINTPVDAWRPYGVRIVDSALNSPNVDIIGTNYYSIHPTKLIVTKNNKTDNNEFSEGENSFAKMIHYYQSTYGKPVIMSEGGPSEEILQCSNYADFPIDMKAFLMTGVAGYYAWNGFRSTEVNLWKSTLSVVKDIPTYLLPILNEINGDWVQGRQTYSIHRKDASPAIELQYYVSQDGIKATGYLRNRTYNFNTKRINENCTLPGYEKGDESHYFPLNQLTNISFEELSRRNQPNVEGLKQKKTYTIQWVNDNVLLERKQIKTNRNGTLILEFPTLTVTNSKTVLPIVWFTLE